MTRSLRILLVPQELASPWRMPVVALLGMLPPDCTPLPERAGLDERKNPRSVGAALALLLQGRARSTVLVATADAPEWCAQALVHAGCPDVVLHPLDHTDLAAPFEGALRRAGVGVEVADVVGWPCDHDACVALGHNRAFTDAIPLVLKLAEASGLAHTRTQLSKHARAVCDALPLPWPASPEGLASTVWDVISHGTLVTPSENYDPFTQGPAGLKGCRLAFVIEKLAQRSGGAERVLIETANALATRGYEIEIVSHEFRGRAPFYPTAPGIRLVNLRPKRELRTRARRALDMIRTRLEEALPDAFPFDRLVWLSRHFGFQRRLGLYLRATRPDAAIAFMPPAVTALASAAPEMALRRVASMHNAPEQDFENPERWGNSRLDRSRRKALMSRMDAISVLLDTYHDWYPVALRPKLVTVPNAVTPVDPQTLRVASRARVVLAVGRLVEVKRPRMLLKVWARIAPAFPDWSLHLHGEGQLHDELLTLIETLGLSDSVVLKGQTRDIGRHYLSASLLAHPAAFEGFPLAVTEALAAGLPVVGFADCSGLNALVADNRNGLLVPAPAIGTEAAADEAARIDVFAEALARVMRDDALRLRLATAAPASVAGYAPERIIDIWEDLVGCAPTQEENSDV